MKAKILQIIFTILYFDKVFQSKTAPEQQFLQGVFLSKCYVLQNLEVLVHYFKQDCFALNVEMYSNFLYQNPSEKASNFSYYGPATDTFSCLIKHQMVYWIIVVKLNSYNIEDVSVIVSFFICLNIYIYIFFLMLAPLWGAS